MATIANTQIGADGRRHPVGELPEASRKRWPWDRRDPAKHQPKVALPDAPVETDQAAVSVGEVVAHPDEDALRTQASGVGFGPRPTSEPEKSVGLDDMTKDELVDYADKQGLAVHRSASKADLRDEIDFLTKPFADMTKAECLEYGDRFGVELKKSGTVGELRAELEAAADNG